ncbi:MAG TPA: penicillin-binding protein activator [Dokdonella sp.]|nr:penicillin-binding protein activator [Dokdonella sp.]
MAGDAALAAPARAGSGRRQAHPGYHRVINRQIQSPMSLPARFASSFRLLFPLLVLLLSACATTTVSSRGDSTQAARAEQLAADGNLEAAAQEFLALADDSRGDASALYRLRAGEVLRDSGDLEGAARAVEDIRRKRLHGDEPLRLDLLEAEVALQRKDPQRAAALLTIAEDSIPPRLRLRVLELRARSAEASGDRFAAARQRAMLDGELQGHDRETNRAQIIETLSALDDSTLKNRAASLRPDDSLLPWIEQALKVRGQLLPREVPRPQRPVGTLMPDAANGMQREGFSAVHQVAILLPLSGQVAGVAQSVLDGFYAAYFADDDGNRPQLRTYDAGGTPQTALAAYNQAVADGAGFVVGPLLREAVGELFRQPLPVRVLALNHPDSGEIPPRGSAEFGLLPDAEGAQAAERMLGLGITRAGVIAAQSDWAERAALAFRAQFEAHGGTVEGEARIQDREFNYKAAVQQAASRLADVSGPDGTSRVSPADAGIFISMRPQQARLLLPQLRLAGISAPVFATSHINSGELNPSLDRDLEGVEFCDATWLFSTVPGRPDRNAIAQQLDSATGLGARLFAFGMDAYALLPYMDWLLAHPDTYLDGASGQLAVDSFGRIHRVLTWARFTDGVARPAQGALSRLPLQ